MPYGEYLQSVPFAWPLMTVLLFLVVLWRVEGVVKPIVINVVEGVAKDASSNATNYAIAVMFGLSASLSAFYDVFTSLDDAALHSISWHQYAALWTKVMNPFIVAVLAYITQSGPKPKTPVSPVPSSP